MEEYVTEGIAEYVEKLFPEGSKGVCVDVGAYDPVWISNSWLFENKGWDVYCVEPNPHCIPLLKEKRKNVYQYALGGENRDNVDFYIIKVDEGFAGPLEEAAGTGLIFHPEMNRFPCTTIKVNVRTLDWLMENEIKQDHIDFLSIDVEGSELDVLGELDVSRWNPKVIVCENILETKDQHDWFERMNYGRIKRIAVNDIYVRISEIQLRTGK